MFEKLMFWKKKEDFSNLGNTDFGMPSDIGGQPTDFGQDNLGLDSTNNDNTFNFNQQTQQSFSQQMPQQPFNMQQTQHPFSQQMPQQPFNTQQTQQPFALQQVSQLPSYTTSQQDPIIGKNIEIVSYKLDVLKSALDSINQRLANLERLAYDKTESYEHEHIGRKGW